MVNRKHGLYGLYKSKYNIFKSKRFRLTSENILLLFMPLLLILVLILPDNAEKPAVIEKEAMSGKASISLVVYNHADAIIDEVDLEDYITGVVAAEMPHSFHYEALKAQAVAARTFALSRMKGLYGSKDSHFGADVCTDPGHCQAWISGERFLESYGNEEDWEKICTAVSETEGIVITYAGKLINPLYHANSVGVTEDIEDVWKNVEEVPYLKSVYSPYEEDYTQYEKITVFSWDEIKSRTEKRFPEAMPGNEAAQDIEILTYSASGRVDKIRLGSVIITGTELRELLGLPSTNLEISFTDDNRVEILSRGYGHGVGMSQCGADALASNGYDYKEILKFYYTGVTVEEIRY